MVRQEDFRKYQDRHFRDTGYEITGPEVGLSFGQPFNFSAICYNSQRISALSIINIKVPGICVVFLEFENA